MTLARSFGLIAFLLASTSFAQELAPGKYSGDFISQVSQGARVAITLDIKKVDGGVIEGTGSRHLTTQQGHRGKACVGEFPLAGTLKGNEIDVRAAEKFGSTGDCQFRLRGTVVDNKIQGKVGPNDIVLTR